MRATGTLRNCDRSNVLFSFLKERNNQEQLQQIAQQFSVERASLEKQMEEEANRHSELRTILQTIMDEKVQLQGSLTESRIHPRIAIESSLMIVLNFS